MRLLILLLILVCLWGCEQTPEVSSESSGAQETSSEESSIPPEESSEEESLPEKQNLVLLYEYYITAAATTEGIVYQYTYCFDEEGKVFNAIAVLTYPSNQQATAEYRDLLMAEFPNVELEDNRLFFSFPKKQCPYYGISYTALPYILEEESIYTITDSYLPSPDEVSETE
jgi:hypothetical protein